MEITYLIGNGFDIACGLKTRYSDFISYYINYPSSEPIITEFKHNISSDLDTWADAERALGDVTKNYTYRSPDFQKCYDDFIYHLSCYLESQQRTFTDKSIENFGTRKFSAGIVEYYNRFTADKKEAIVQWIKQNAYNDLFVNFLIFNYTNTFENLLNHVVDNENVISVLDNKVYNGINFSSLKEIEYVHSNIDNLPLILGVNDDSQISDSILCLDNDIVSTLVKPESNAAIRRSVMDRCRNIITRSDIICIYGMSIGTTDKHWWQIIHDWLTNDIQTILIIFWWDPLCVKSSTGSCLSAQKRFEESLCEKMKFSETEIDSVRDRIYVAFNSNPFGF